MKNLFSVATLLLAAHLSFGQAARPGTISYPALDEKYGFRDVRFETDTTQIKDLKAIERKGNRTVFVRPTDSNKVGDAKVARITYGFYKGQLADVILTTKGIESSRALLAALEGQYGSGIAVATGSQDKVWNGQRVRMTYVVDAFYNATIKMAQKQLTDQYQQDQKSFKKNTTGL